MKNKMKYMFLALAGALTMAVSCQMEDLLSDTDVKEGYTDIELSVNVPVMQKVDTRAVDPDGGGVQSIVLFCFDKYGYFITTVKADIKPDTDDLISLSGTMKASIPNHTEVVHFIGNQNLSYFTEGNYQGLSEVTVMTTLHASPGRMIYWARKNASELAPGTTVTLLRNQAKFTVNTGTSGFEEKGWIVLNTSAYGTVAPYNSDRTAENGGFVAPTLSAPFVTIPHDDTRLKNYYDVRIAEDEYVFETDNTEAAPVEIIIKGSYKGGEDLYYRVSLIDDDGNYIQVMRNHHYVINVDGELSYGQKTYNDALTAPATNNVWISISDNVHEVMDNDYILSVDETAVIIGEEDFTTPNTYKLYYTIKSNNGNAITDADKAEVYWLDGNNVAEHLFNHTFSNGRGEITVTLFNMGGEAKREGTLFVKKGRLHRKIKVITVKKFNFEPAWITTNIYALDPGENVTIMFTVPDDCPPELFPMDVLVSTDHLDVRNASGMVLPVIRADDERYGEDNGIGYKYVLTVTQAGTQRVYLKTSLPHEDNEYTSVKIEAEHFHSISKSATFHQQVDSRIMINNLRSYVATTPADEYIYYYLVPQKINAPVEFQAHLGKVVNSAPAAGKGVSLTNPKNEVTHFEYISPNVDFSTTDGDGYNVDEFLLYSQNLEHNHDYSSSDYYFDMYTGLNSANWSASGGRVLGFFRNNISGNPGEGAVFHLKTTKPKSDEVVRISSNVFGAPSVTTGTKGSKAVMDYVAPDGKCTGTGVYRSVVFELSTFHPFHFAASVNGQGSPVSGKDEEITGETVEVDYFPGSSVEVEFDITSFKSSIQGIADAEQLSVDPFGTEFKVYIDAPMLEIDAARNTLPSDKFYYDETIDKFVYVVEADRDAERSYGYSAAKVQDGSKLDAFRNPISGVDQSGERKKLYFLTRNNVSEGEIVLSSEEEKVVYFSKTFVVQNTPIEGNITYGASKTPVPHESFVPFEVVGTYDRIGIMTITADGKYILYLRSEYKYDKGDKVKLQYKAEDGKVYETEISSLESLLTNSDINLTLS